jgi:predicted Rossmann-fold nucleotide-binding protein
MSCQWPVDLWNSGRCDKDTPAYESARNDALKRLQEELGTDPFTTVIAVSGSATSTTYSNEAQDLGMTIANSGLNLTTGGLGGIMLDVTRGFFGKLPLLQRPFNSRSAESMLRDKAVGILPEGRGTATDALEQAKLGTRPLLTALHGRDSKNTHLGPASRNHVLICGAFKVVCMPGTGGSIAEAELAARWYRKPVIAYHPKPHSKEWDPWSEKVRELGIEISTDLSYVRQWMLAQPAVAPEETATEA